MKKTYVQLYAQYKVKYEFQLKTFSSKGHFTQRAMHQAMSEGPFRKMDCDNAMRQCD